MEPLSVIADNPTILAALRALLEEEIQTFPSDSALSFSNERLGEMARARMEGQRAIDSAMKRIARLNTTSDTPPRRNEAR